MNTVSLNSLWSYLQSLSLTASNKKWLADHLYESVKEESVTPLQPLTMEEIDAMLDEAERDFEAGEYLTQDEVFHQPKAVIA